VPTQMRITDSGTTLPFSPTILSPSSIATGGANAEPYQSMLVKVQSVAVTVQNPDAPSDFDEFKVTGGLRIDDEIFTALDNTYSVGATFSSIAGPLTFAHSDSKIVPRSAADLVAP
jgi:hypothetical protein